MEGVILFRGDQVGIQFFLVLLIQFLEILVPDTRKTNKAKKFRFLKFTKPQ
jgi:hypothetical protein